MSIPYEENDKYLSECETLIMKIVWDFGKDIPLAEIRKTLRLRYNKDYKPSTMSTFLSRLFNKGFAKTYKISRCAYVRALKSEEAYKQKVLQDELNLWFNGNMVEYMATLSSVIKFSKEDIREIRGVLDNLDS